MIGKLKQPLFLLSFIALLGVTLLGFANVHNLPDKNRSARILWLNQKNCSQPIQLSKEYGEATVTVTCANNKAYLLVAHEHCNFPYSVINAYCWDVETLGPNMLERTP